jgi:hypothetical protein
MLDVYLEKIMIERRVTHSRKDKDGDIVALCNSFENWSPRYKAVAIQDIESGSIRYYIQDSNGTKINICVVKGFLGKYLRTILNGPSLYKLKNLPDCR